MLRGAIGFRPGFDTVRSRPGARSPAPRWLAKFVRASMPPVPTGFQPDGERGATSELSFPATVYRGRSDRIEG